jgi:hypothetical protein
MYKCGPEYIEREFVLTGQIPEISCAKVHTYIGAIDPQNPSDSRPISGKPASWLYITT